MILDSFPLIGRWDYFDLTTLNLSALKTEKTKVGKVYEKKKLN